MKRPSTPRALLLAAGLLCGAAQAGVITFDPVDEQGATLAAGDMFSAQDFQFTQTSDFPSLLFAADLTGAYASNGSATLYAANNAGFSVKSTGPSGRFSFAGFELGGGNLAALDPGGGGVEAWARQVDVLGILADSSQLMASFMVDQTSTGLSAQMLNWTGLVDLRFSAVGDFSLDNLNLTTLPEPSALALVGLALAGLAASRRRRA